MKTYTKLDHVRDAYHVCDFHECNVKKNAYLLCCHFEESGDSKRDSLTGSDVILCKQG